MRFQVHVWCVCDDESKGADTQNPFLVRPLAQYAGGNPANHNLHKNAGEA